MMIIQTKRLVIRELTMDDVRSLYVILSDPETMQYYPKPFTLSQVESWIAWNLINYAAYGFGLWGVVLKDTGECIGDCGITMQRIDGSKQPEIGYHIHKEHTNQGYATEAALACRNYAFESAGLKTVYSYMKSTNLSSRRVAEKMGMRMIKEMPDEKKQMTAIYAIALEEYCNLAAGGNIDANGSFE